MLYESKLDYILPKQFINYFWPSVSPAITKTRLFKYVENFTSKNWKFSNKKNSDIFFIFLLNA